MDCTNKCKFLTIDDDKLYCEYHSQQIITKEGIPQRCTKCEQTTIDNLINIVKKMQYIMKDDDTNDKMKYVKDNLKYLNYCLEDINEITRI